MAWPANSALAGEAEPAPWLTQLLAGTRGPVIAATDYVRAVPETVRAFVPPGAASSRWGRMGLGAAIRGRRCGRFSGGCGGGGAGGVVGLLMGVLMVGFC
jgi:hypothetical protein